MLNPPIFRVPQRLPLSLTNGRESGKVREPLICRAKPAPSTTPTAKPVSNPTPTPMTEENFHCNPDPAPGIPAFAEPTTDEVNAAAAEPLATETRTVAFRPLGGRVLVLPDEPEDRSAGGILLPDTALTKKFEGTVLATGPGFRDDQGHLVPMTVQVGDRVVYNRFAGTEVKLDNVAHLLMHEGDILGLVVEN